MRTLIMTVLLLGSTAAMARDMFVVVNTRDTEVDVYRCNCGVDDPDCEPITRTVVRSVGSMNWHVVGGVAPYTLISALREDHNGNISVTVMDAVGTISTSYGTIGTQIRYFDMACEGVKEENCATPLFIPSQKKAKDQAKARTPSTGPVREPRTYDPDRVREPVQPSRTSESTFEVRPSRERPSPAPAPPPAPAPVRSVQHSR